MKIVLPLVDRVIHKPEGKRRLGLLKGKFKTPDHILEEDREINAMFSLCSISMRNPPCS